MPRSRTLWISLSALVVFSCLASCRRVPADLPDVEPEPSGRSSVIVESEPKQQEGALLSPLTDEAISLYTCWFEDPYSYMFSHHHGEPLVIGHNSYGMLMAGSHGVLYYGALNECAARMVGTSTSNYADLEPISVLAGVPVTLPNPNLPFDTVNPDFLRWVRVHLLPAAEQSIDGISVQLAYDRVFSRMCRQFGEALFYLLDEKAIDSEASQYVQAVQQKGVDGIDWLEQRYVSVTGQGGYRDYTTLTPPMAVGFWLRRHLDGSLPACWHTLREVFERYDRAWFDDLRANYPKAAAAVAQLPDTSAP